MSLNFVNKINISQFCKIKYKFIFNVLKVISIISKNQISLKNICRNPAAWTTESVQRQLELPPPISPKIEEKVHLSPENKDYQKRMHAFHEIAGGRGVALQ
jgi:hypothetical protein